MKHFIVSILIVITPFIGTIYKKPIKVERRYETFKITDR